MINNIHISLSIYDFTTVCTLLYQFLGIAMSVRALSEQLKSRDRFLVRYATGAMRNVAVDEKVFSIAYVVERVL